MALWQQILMKMDVAITGAALIVMLLFFHVYGRRKSVSRVLTLPPGPIAWPLIGNIHNLGALPHRGLLKLSKKYGPIMTLKLGSKPVVIVSSPEVARECLKLNDMTFASRPRGAAGDILGYGSSDIVFTHYGPKWRSMRRALNEEMLQSSRLSQYRGLRKDELLVVFRSALEASKTGGAIKTLRTMENLTTNNVSRMLMSECYQGPYSTCTAEEGEEISDMIHEISYLAGVFNFGDWMPAIKRFDLQGLETRMKNIHIRLDVLLQAIVDKRRARIESPAGETQPSNLETSDVQDFVDAMLRKPPSERLTDTQIKAILTDILVAAAETTASTFEWTLTDLIRHPEIMKKVQAELDSVVGPDRVVEEADLPKFEYLRSVIKESMRLRTTVPLMVPHETTQRCTIAGYDIPARTVVFFNIFAIQHDSSAWKSPETFMPERFDRLVSTVDVQGQHYQLLPFGSGRRMCPGWNMAMIILQYTLGMLLHAFDWSLPAGQKPEDLCTKEKFGLTVFKKVPLELIPTPRLASQVYDIALQS